MKYIVGFEVPEVSQKFWTELYLYHCQAYPLEENLIKFLKGLKSQKEKITFM